MDKIKALGKLMEYSVEFESNGESWKLTSGYGDVLLENAKSHIVYALDYAQSSVINLTLLSMTVRKRSYMLKYKLSVKVDSAACILSLETRKEILEYCFKRQGGGFIEYYESQFATLQGRMKICSDKMAITGTFKAENWKEYGLHEAVVEFDYSFLNLSSTPLIFVDYMNRNGYISIKEKNPINCQLFISLNPMGKSPATIEGTIFQYCLFPYEGPELPLEEKKLKQEEDITSYQRVRELNSQGRELK